VDAFARASVRTVLILKADRLYADYLRESVGRTFPQARIVVTSTVTAAAVALALERVDLLVTGVGAALEGDVLDLLARRAGEPTAERRTLVVTGRHEYRVTSVLHALAIQGVFDSGQEAPEALRQALEAVAAGRRWWSAGFADQLQGLEKAPAAPFRLLSVLEQLVLSVLGDGCDDATAAAELGLSPGTIVTVRRDLHRKLGVQHRGDLVRMAAQHGFVRFTPDGVVRPGFGLLRAQHESRRKLPAGLDRRRRPRTGRSDDTAAA
jgi:two-component system capsular synthesis response regulator RcsB